MSTAYISSFVYGKNVDIVKSKNDDFEDTNITIISSITLASVPEYRAINALCSLFGDNLFDNNSIRVYFKDPDGEILSQYNCLLDKKMLQMSDGEIPDAIMFNIALKLHFQKTGIYTTELFFNASQLGEYKLKVSMR